MKPLTKSLVTFEAPVELLERFDQVVTARYTNRSAFLRELMAREADAFFGSGANDVQEQPRVATATATE